MSKAKIASERQRQPTEIRRQLIVEAARTVIADKGIYATTTRDIAASAEVSSGTLMYHFSGIAEVLREVIHAEMVKFYRPIAERSAAADSAAEALQILIDGFFDDDQRAVEHWRLWLDYWSLSAHDEAYAEVQRDVYDQWRSDVRAVLMRGRDEGHLQIADLDLAIKDFMAVFDGLAVQAYLPTTPKGPLEARADLTSWVHRTLTPDPDPDPDPDAETVMTITTPSPTIVSPYRQPGHSLPGHLYTSDEAYQQDLGAVFGRSWLFVANEAEIPEPGDFVTIDIDTRSVILVRDDDMSVNAFHNVCRHRGSRLLDDCNGSVGNIVCPYHQWTYDTTGALLYAESSGSGFDKSAYSLRPVHVRSVSGLLFICLAAETPDDFDDFAATVTPYLAPHGLGELKVAAQTDLVEHGNWKLVMENNRECVHCGGHPELLRSFFPVYGYAADEISPRLRPAYNRFLAAQAEFETTCRQLGLQWETVEQLDDRPTGFRIQREPLDLAGESFTLDGVRASRKLIMPYEQAKLGRLTLHVQPNAWFHVLSDHVVTFSLLPTGPGTSVLRTTWLVQKDAVEGVDYDLENLMVVWRQTNDQDCAYVARAHRGVSSPDYVPGPYLPAEYQVDAFCSWYTDRLAAFDDR